MGLLVVALLAGLFFWLGWMLRASCCDCLAFRKDQRPAEPESWGI